MVLSLPLDILYIHFNGQFVTYTTYLIGKFKIPLLTQLEGSCAQLNSIRTTTEMNMQNFPTCFTQIKYKSTDIIRHIMNLNEQILSCILNGNIY